MRPGSGRAPSRPAQPGSRPASRPHSARTAPAQQEYHHQYSRLTELPVECAAGRGETTRDLRFARQRAPALAEQLAEKREQEERHLVRLTGGPSTARALET